MQNPQVADLDYSDLPLTNEPHMVYCFFNNICTGIFELQNHWSNKTQPPLDFGLLGQCKANSLILHFLGAKYVLPVHIQLGHCANSSIWSCFISDLIWHIFFFLPVWAFYHRRLEIRTTAKHAWPWQSSGQRTSMPPFHGFLWLRSMPDTVLDWHGSALLGTDNTLLGRSSPCHATDPVPTEL